jgi:hypothetical protein
MFQRLATLPRCHYRTHSTFYLPAPSGGWSTLGASRDVSPLKLSISHMNPSYLLLVHSRMWQSEIHFHARKNVNNVLNKFQHDNPKTPQHTPSKYITPVYGEKIQYATQDETPLLSSKQCTTIEKITSSVLYYSRAVDPTVIIPLNDIATEHTTATEKHKQQQVNCWTVWWCILTPQSAFMRQIWSCTYTVTHHTCQFPKQKAVWEDFLPRVKFPQWNQTQWVYSQHSFRYQKCGCVSSGIRNWFYQ